jgi:Domain of unknown function (DUF5076)
MREQPVPDAALRDGGATEMARIWVAEHGLHCSLRIGVYDDTPIDEARAWGMMLADLLRHVGRGLSAYYQREAGEVVEAVLGRPDHADRRRPGRRAGDSVWRPRAPVALNRRASKSRAIWSLRDWSSRTGSVYPGEACARSQSPMRRGGYEAWILPEQGPAPLGQRQ